jgi:hypothetical protein
VLQRARIENGRLVLPDGMSYRVLAKRFRPQHQFSVEKLTGFVNAGMILIRHQTRKNRWIA